MSERLRQLATNPAPDQREYRTEKDSFSRVISFGHTNGQVQPTSFKVWTRDGTIQTYGGVAAARLIAFQLTGADAENPRFDASASRVIAAWPLSKIEDRDANAIDIEYSRFETAAKMHSVEMLPRFFRYEPDRHVELVYEDRDDQIDTFHAGQAGGVHTRIDQRLSAIKMVVADVSVREYRLAYRDDNMDNIDSITGRSLLETITEYGLKAQLSSGAGFEAVGFFPGRRVGQGCVRCPRYAPHGTYDPKRRGEPSWLRRHAIKGPLVETQPIARP